MRARSAEPAQRTERTHERAVERPSRRPTREPERSEGARGTHDVSALPVAAPRAVSLWRRRGAVAAGAARRRPVVQAKRRMSRPRDPCEREADAVAARVVACRTPVPPAAGRVAAPHRLLRSQSPIRGPPDSDVPATVEAAIDRPAPGHPLDPDLRRRIEPHVGADLGAVRVRREPAAARAIGARAFTSGNTIFLGRGESATDVELIAHETTHVVQQTAAPAAVAPVMRSSLDLGIDIDIDIDLEDVVPQVVIDGVRDRVRSIPGYTLLTQIAGQDLLTREAVSFSRTELIEELLAWGPFAPAVGPVLQTIEVIDDLFTFISEGLTQNRLTLDRLSADVAEAWTRLSWREGIEGNLAIVRGYIDALLRDVGTFVDGIVDRVLEIVRAAVVMAAKPFLESERIKPTWELAKKVLHYDPLLGERVDVPTEEILADFLRFIGQERRLAQMQERGTLAKTAEWLDLQFVTFESIIEELGTLFSDAWEAIQPENLPGLLDTLPELADRAFGLIGRIGDFADTVIDRILELIKEALLGWLSEHAHAIPGFRLITVIIGQNPFTGEAVERNAANLIGGFITLLPNGEATYQQLSESGVIAEAAGQIESAMSSLGISLELILSTFRGVWDMLDLDALLEPLAAFDRIVERFGEPIGRIFAFIGVVVETVISLVLRLMNFPSDLLASIIANVTQAIADIQRDPVGFLMNLLEALKQGLTGFFDNILTYLLQGLAAWLFRGLGQIGITIPTDFTPMSILTLVLEVLGLTVDHLWEKLGEHIGPERAAMIRGALDRLGEAWAFIQDVQQRGLAAIWDYIATQLGNLWDTLLGMAQEWIMTTIISNVVTRLISMLDPTGVMAIVNSFVAFFNAVQSAIEYLRDILEIINQYVTTLAQIAAGNITPGAQMLEQALAAAIPIAIGFLANQVGIGNIPEKIVEIIGRLRELIDQALDWLIAQALRLGQAALNALGIGQEPEVGQETAGPGDVDHVFALGTDRHTLRVHVTPTGVELQMASNGFGAFRDRLQRLETTYQAQFSALPSAAALGPKLHDEIELIRVESVALEGQAEQLRPRDFRATSEVARRQGEFEAAMSTGLRQLEQKLQALGTHFAFGSGAGAAVNDSLLLEPNGASPRIGWVDRVGLVLDDGNDYHFGILVRTATSDAPIPRFYKDHGTTWALAPVPAVATAATAGTMFTMSGNWRVMPWVGVPLNTNPTNPTVTPPGFGAVASSGRVYGQRGHLIANKFFGPNGDPRNIEAMHTGSNQGGMSPIERTIKSMIETTGLIYRIEAQPLPAGKQPPDQFEVRCTKVFPLPVASPMTFPLVNNA